MQEWIDREEALSALGVRQQTLYAYVSRGLIERRIDPADSRRSLYRGEDIAALVKRRSRGKRIESIAASTVAWGEPVIPTRLSTVVHGRLIFRGKDAVRLAAAATLEQVAALLWDLPEAPDFDAPAAEADPFQALARSIGGARSTVGRPRAKLCIDAARAVATIAASLGAEGEGPVHQRLARQWRLDPEGADHIRTALVLLADHELNPSTFAARVAVSTGASIAASLLAGLGALSGPRHGGAGAAVAALVAEAGRSGPDAAISRWLATERSLPGFGHPLYQYGDPRAAALLQRLPVDPMLDQLRMVVLDVTGALPNIDFALAVLASILGLPEDMSFRLFAIARSVGWAAHAMEQAADGTIIRPRARYFGPIPDLN